MRHDAAVVNTLGGYHGDILVLPQIGNGGKPAASKCSGSQPRLFFKRNHTCAGVGNELRHDAVEVWLAFHVVVGISLKNDVIAAHPFLKFKRTAADRVLVIALVLPWIGSFVNVTREDPIGW